MRQGTEWFPSPNFRRAKREIQFIVIHATATSGISSPREWLCNPASKVSAHYLIGRDGKILQLVEDSNISWHAGESSWAGKTNLNNSSIGIELVNANDGKMNYPEEQFEACLKITSDMAKEFKVKLSNIVRHLDIAPVRKTDPAGFPWDDFKMRLHDLGVA